MLSSLVGFEAVSTATNAVRNAITEAVNDYRKFEVAIREVSTLVDSSVVDNESLAKSVNNVALAYGTDVIDSARALYQIISAGAAAGADASTMLEIATKLSVGGVTTSAIAADGLTTAINAWSLGAEGATRVSDVMFATMKAGKTTIGELSQNMGMIASGAARLHVPIEAIGASFVQITKAGVNTNMAAIGLNAALTSILQPTDEAADEAKRLGIEFNAAALETKGWIPFLQDIADKGGATNTSLGILFNNVMAGRTLAPLFADDMRGLKEAFDETSNAIGATDEAVSKMSGSFDESMNRIESLSKMAKRSFAENVLQIGMYAKVGSAIASLGSDSELEVAKAKRAIAGLVGQMSLLDTLPRMFNFLLPPDEIIRAKDETGKLVDMTFRQAVEAEAKRAKETLRIQRERLEATKALEDEARKAAGEKDRQDAAKRNEIIESADKKNKKQKKDAEFDSSVREEIEIANLLESDNKAREEKMRAHRAGVRERDIRKEEENAKEKKKISEKLLQEKAKSDLELERSSMRAAHTVGGPIAGMFSSMISGAQNFGEAFKSMIQGMVVKVVSSGIISLLGSIFSGGVLGIGGLFTSALGFRHGGIAHARSGMLLSGYGGGDRVPLMAERGELVVRKELAQQAMAAGFGPGGLGGSGSGRSGSSPTIVNVSYQTAGGLPSSADVQYHQRRVVIPAIDQASVRRKAFRRVVK